MGCCDVGLFLDDNNTLLCKECRVAIRNEKRQSGRRCVVKYWCPLCGKNRHYDCGMRARVESSQGTVSIVCE